MAERSASDEPAAAKPQHANPGDSTTIENAANDGATDEGATLDGATLDGATSETATDESGTDEPAIDETKPATTPVSAPPRTAAPLGKQGSAKKPPAGAGVEAPPVVKPGSADKPAEAEAEVEAGDRDHPHDIASSLGRPELEVNDVSGPNIGAFGFGSDLVGSVGSYNEPGKRSDQSQDHSSSGYGRRGRSSRSYSIPRLSKSKRAGVSPGA